MNELINNEKAIERVLTIEEMIGDFNKLNQSEFQTPSVMMKLKKE